MMSFQDAVGRLGKAEAVARHAVQVDPNCEVKGINMCIPMPGHCATDDDWRMDAEELAKLVCSHNVVFLLTDSRESRWLPTVLGKVHGKLVITIALGFDNYVVMKHGPSCYFCNDIIAPTNVHLFKCCPLIVRLSATEPWTNSARSHAPG